MPLPELKKGDVLKTEGNTVTVCQVKRGTEFDEPVYRLVGPLGVKLRNWYTGEELARWGYRVEGEEGI
jgi:hypothetical protein